ncbi:hypothetical protein H8E07_19570 [bacterium]|nr:hypothetical protein [bacterium]
MGLLWFGNAKGIEDLKVKDLRKERIRQDVEQDHLVARIKAAGNQYDGYLDAASEPRTSEAEIEGAAYKMDRAMKRKNQAESHLQQAIPRITVIDSTIDILEQRKELEKKGIWKVIAGMDDEKLLEQLQVFAAERKENHLGVERIAELMDVDDLDVKANRGAGFRRARADIKAVHDYKTG